MVLLARTCVILAGVSGLACASAATAASATFSYSVSGQGNQVVDPVTGILSYAFVPDGAVATPFGPLLVSYSGEINLALTPPSGPTMALWDFGAVGTFFGPGIEFILAVDPETFIAPFYGTSTIVGGTGIFAGATGTTSYDGLFNVATGAAQFVERIEISGPNVPEIPEPETWAMLIAGFGLVGSALRRKRAIGQPATL